MTIQLFDPFSRAWERMKQALFKPFDIMVWFKVGFTAFLATLMDGNGGGGNGGRLSRDVENANWGEVLNSPYEAWSWLIDNPGWSVFIGFGILVVLAIVIVLLWVSSRGKFMFLDNVVHKRALIGDPWKQYKSQGDSLFFWRLGLALVFIAVFGSLVWFAWTHLHAHYSEFHEWPILLIVQLVFAFFLLILLASYIELLLTGFVVPVMYRHRILATEAWSRFLSIHWANFGYFLLYAIIVALLWLGISVAIIMLGLMTCCCGFIILAIPYLGTVILLPIYYLFRAYSIEFLAQFGDDFNVFLPVPLSDQPGTGGQVDPVGENDS